MKTPSGWKQGETIEDRSHNNQQEQRIQQEILGRMSHCSAPNEERCRSDLCTPSVTPVYPLVPIAPWSRSEFLSFSIHRFVYERHDKGLSTMGVVGWEDAAKVKVMSDDVWDRRIADHG